MKICGNKSLNDWENFIVIGIVKVCSFRGVLLNSQDKKNLVIDRPGIEESRKRVRQELQNMYTKFCRSWVYSLIYTGSVSSSRNSAGWRDRERVWVEQTWTDSVAFRASWREVVPFTTLLLLRIIIINTCYYLCIKTKIKFIRHHFKIISKNIPRNIFFFQFFTCRKNFLNSFIFHCWYFFFLFLYFCLEEEQNLNLFFIGEFYYSIESHFFFLKL